MPTIFTINFLLYIPFSQHTGHAHRLVNFPQAHCDEKSLNSLIKVRIQCMFEKEKERVAGQQLSQCAVDRHLVA